MLPILYTHTDALRSTLGLSEEDLSDMDITARSLDKELGMDLNSWCSNHITTSDAVNAGSGTQAQIDIMDALSLYSSYFCAKLVVPSLQLGAAQAISDGKNALNRYSTVDFDKLYDRISERVAFYKKYILEINTDLATTTATVLKVFSLAGSAYNPVTGA